MKSDLVDLRPTGRSRLIDLVEAAGIDVSPWSDFKGGQERAASNPKYCYRWAYLEPKKVAVVNVWHHELDQNGGDIVLQDNLAKRAASYGNQKAGTWRRRAEQLDDVVRTAWLDGLPVRAILLARKKEPRPGEAAKVSARDLDVAEWAVTEYSPDGSFTITRGAIPIAFVDQFELPDVDQDSVTERKERLTLYFERNPEVRRRALARAAGRCEYCSSFAFKTPRNAWFLETHHVVPLSEGGPDTVGNVAALCPTHHREAHHGEHAEQMRSALLRHIRKKDA